jgi:serine protease AprX
MVTAVIFRPIVSLSCAVVLVATSVLNTAAAGAPASATFVAPALLQAAQAQPNALVPVILQLRSGPGLTSQHAAQTALDVLRQNGKADNALGIVSGASGRLNAAAINALTHDPRVAAIYADEPVKRRLSEPNLTTSYPVETQAVQAWSHNLTGQGVTVAVLDSGIDSSDPDVAGRVLTEVNFADPHPNGQFDPGGHGTHVAGIIGGNGAASAGQFVGVAPQANLVDVRVLDANGVGSTSTILAGLQWTIGNAATYGIRVINLSLGTTPSTDYVHDPIAAAAEIAWLRGLTVVAASGNSGSGNVDTPGIDPYVITVGAEDDQSTTALGDDVVPSWSGWGTPPNGTAKPDLVAPGRKIISLYVPGSTLATAYPDHLVTATNGASYLRLSGTSQATAVISGTVALLLQAQPGLRPNQVKAMLTTTAVPFGQNTGVLVPSPSVGSGLGNAAGTIAASSTAHANHGLRVADPSADVLFNLLQGQPLFWKDPTYMGIDWTQVNWSNIKWSDYAWDNVIWDDFGWDTLNWTSLGFSGYAWNSYAWDDFGWDSIAAGGADPN